VEISIFDYNIFISFPKFYFQFLILVEIYHSNILKTDDIVIDLIKTTMELQLDGELDRCKCTCSFESRPFKLVATIDDR